MFGRQFPTASLAAKAELERFLASDLYHHRFTREQLAKHPDVPEIMIDLYDQMSNARMALTMFPFALHSISSVDRADKSEACIVAWL